MCKISAHMAEMIACTSYQCQAFLQIMQSTAEKNLKALKTIMASLPSTTRLAFVGDGPERAALQQHYADMPNVKFMVSVKSASDTSVSSVKLPLMDAPSAAATESRGVLVAFPNCLCDRNMNCRLFLPLHRVGSVQVQECSSKFQNKLHWGIFLFFQLTQRMHAVHRAR